MNKLTTIIASVVSGILVTFGSGLGIIEILKEIFGEQFPLDSPLDVIEGIIIGSIMTIIGVFVYIKIPDEKIEGKKE